MVWFLKPVSLILEGTNYPADDSNTHKGMLRDD